jgi:integrase
MLRFIRRSRRERRRSPAERESKLLPRVLAPAEARRLLAAAADNPKHQALIAIGLYAGLRAAEIVALKVSDIDHEQGLIRVRLGKGGREGIVPLNPRLLPYIKPFLGGEPEAPLVPGRYPRQHYATRSLQEAVADAASRAGLSGHVHPHTLRHTFGTEVQRRTKDLAKTQRLLRHQNVQTTMIYVHLAVDDVREYSDELDFD